MMKFKVGDYVEVIKPGYGFVEECVGDRMYITDKYDSEWVYVSKDYPFSIGPEKDSTVSVRSFKLVEEEK